MDFLLQLFGVLLIVEGAPWFLAPGGMRRWLQQVMAVRDSHLRVAGCLLMILGLALVYVATR